MSATRASKVENSPDACKTAAAYLTLWKALDVHFPGHELLEITNEKAADVTAEVEVLSKQDINRWAYDPTTLTDAIENTLKRLRQRVKDESWFNETRILKDCFRDKALNYAEHLP